MLDGEGRDRRGRADPPSIGRHAIRVGPATEAARICRDTVAVNTLLGWYRSGDVVAAKLPLLSTYLGHVDPAAT